MKTTAFIIKIFFTFLAGSFIFLTAHTQSIVDFRKLPNRRADTVIHTIDLLTQLHWEDIVDYSKKTEGHYTNVGRDSFLVNYEYVKQGRDLYFKIVSFRGFVLRYEAYSGGIIKLNTTGYFNKALWLDYADTALPTLPKKFKLTKEEPDSILKAYYRLLGLGTRDEYGFICEYSTVGMPPERRMSVIFLIVKHRIDLIKKLTDYSNLQTKLYATDALIYIDFTAKQKIKNLENDIRQKQKQLDRLQKKNGDTAKIEMLTRQIKADSDTAAMCNGDLLTKEEWQSIYDFRDSNQTIITCGNSGSYKYYGTLVSELLSEKAIAEIPKWYESLKSNGYFHYMLR